MRREELNKAKNSYFKRRIVARAIAIIALSIIVTGILAILFSSHVLSDDIYLPLRDEINQLIPGAYEVILMVLFALLMSILLVRLLLRNLIDSLTGKDEPHKIRQSEEWDSDFEPFPDLQDADNPDKSIPEAVHSDTRKTIFSDFMKQELDAEKQLTNLLFTLLNANKDDTFNRVQDILSALGSFSKCEFAAIYKREGESSTYLKFGAWDSDPEMARHSVRIEAIDLPAYRWMNKSLKNGKAFTFRTSMLDNLMETVQGAAEDVKAWMRMQAQESAEHKLCKHEGWEHFIGFPLSEGEAIAGIFLMGFQKPELPLNDGLIERLTVISNTMVRQLVTDKLQEAKDDSAENLQQTLNNLDDAIFTTRLDGSILMLNKAAAKLSGAPMEAAVGKSWSEVFHLIGNDTRTLINDPIAKLYKDYSGSMLLRDISLITAADKELEIEGMAAPIQNKRGETIGVVFILRDISNRLKEEEERSQVLRMEAVSSLSSGFAHDFNNILTAILGNISLVLDDLPPDSEQAALLKAAEESTLRGKDITDKMLAMAKSSPVSDVATETVKNLEQYVRNLVSGTNVRPVFRLIKDLPNIRMAAPTYEKIISHVVTNALQAMNNTGVLTVSAKMYEALENGEIPLRQGKYICINIKDSGEGIAYENLNRVFVPYFTTRQGASGLGLPIVYSLLKKHGGYIRLNSKPGKGTDAEMYMPIGDSIVTPKAEAKPATPQTPPLALVLDEDDALGNLLIKTMTSMGLRVQKTTDPEELSSLFFKSLNTSSPARIVLADLNLPGAGDITSLMLILKKSDPNVKIIAYSNLLNLDDLDDFEKKGFDDILQKPFNISDLRAVIKRNSYL
jgi:PAS domain S-box-containing protein